MIIFLLEGRLDSERLYIQGRHDASHVAAFNFTWIKCPSFTHVERAKGVLGYTWQCSSRSEGY